MWMSSSHRTPPCHTGRYARTIPKTRSDPRSQPRLDQRARKPAYPSPANVLFSRLIAIWLPGLIQLQPLPRCVRHIGVMGRYRQGTEFLGGFDRFIEPACFGVSCGQSIEYRRLLPLSDFASSLSQAHGFGAIAEFSLGTGRVNPSQGI